MLILGVCLVVAAVVLVILGVTSAAVSWLLWLGIGLAVVAVVLIAVTRLSGRGSREL